VGPLPQIQILNDPFHGFVENLGGEPLALDGPPAEPVDRATVEIAQADAGRGHEQRLRLVRDLLQQPKDPPDPDDFASFVLADLQDTAPRVGESADPLQVLVVLGALPQDVAGVRRHGWGRADRGE